MKIVFAGPSLHGSRKPVGKGIVCRPPAAQGDIVQAVRDGASVIGLIDGVYENVAAIWHKEILYGLYRGVRIYGAASLGALRAAECASFGMIGLGAIFEGYLCGLLQDDADVALIHGPAELGYLPLSEPLVNVRATLIHHTGTGFLDDVEFTGLLRTAENIFFKNRTWRSIVAGSRISDQARAQAILDRLSHHAVNQKRIDAEMLLQHVTDADDALVQPSDSWKFAQTSLFERLCLVDLA
jgi:hypothetical protein